MKRRSSDKVFVFVDTQGSEREREIDSMNELYDHVTVESKEGIDLKGYL